MSRSRAFILREPPFREVGGVVGALFVELRDGDEAAEGVVTSGTTPLLLLGCAGEAAAVLMLWLRGGGRAADEVATT